MWFAKTIVFCVDIDHAERMAEALRNENQDLVAKNAKYVMQITGDNEEGKRELDNFQNRESKYPVIVTTSKLLTTGVDVPTCKIIALDTNINSMTEFKQIIGRGTRLAPDFGKYYFTIVDFRKNARNFAADDFDGPPIQDKRFGEDDEIDETDPDNTDQTGAVEEPTPDYSETETEPDTGQGGEIIEDPDPMRKVTVNGVEVTVLNELVQYYGADGKLTSKSLTDYTKKNIRESYASLDHFLVTWQAADKKQAIIEELDAQGIFLPELQALVGKELDPFDLICHLAFDMPPLSRKERADKVKKRNYFGKYSENAVKVLEKLLEKYANEGIENIESPAVLKLDPLNTFGTPREIFGFFGKKKDYLNAVKELEQEIYKAA